MARNYETAVRQMYAALLIARDTLDHMTTEQFSRGEDRSARNSIANAIGDYEQKRPEVKAGYAKDDPHTTLATPPYTKNSERAA
jgi:hypothetical protein